MAAYCLGLATLQVSARTPASNGILAYAPAPESEQEGKKEGRELIYKFINLSILVGALAYVLRKPVADFFAQRSASIRTALEEGRKALEASQAQLSPCRSAAAEAAEKIIQSARAQTDVAARAAKLELKMYTAQQAVKLAEEMIRQRLDDAGRKKLVADFLTDVETHPHQN